MRVEISHLSESHLKKNIQRPPHPLRTHYTAYSFRYTVYGIRWTGYGSFKYRTEEYRTEEC